MDICSMCFGDNEVEAVTLVNCLHVICRSCIARSIAAQEAFKCPLQFCNAPLLPEEIQMALEKGYDENATPVPGIDQSHNQQSTSTAQVGDFEDMEVESNNNDELLVKCAICLDSVKGSEVVVLESCLHMLCKNCIRMRVQAEEGATVLCPMVAFMGCKGILNQQEVKISVPEEEFDRWLERSVNAFRQEMTNVVTCATPNCKGWYEAEEGRNIFTCEVCDARNCKNCQAIHDDLDCETYQDLLGAAIDGNEDIQQLIERVKKSGWVQLKQMVMAHGPEVLDNDLMCTVTDIQCVICFNTIPPGDGIILHDCLHTSCKDCIVNVINHCEGPEVNCPFTDGDSSCKNTLKPREIKALVSPEELERLMNKVALVAEGITPNAFHCMTVNCPGWYEIASDQVTNFRCFVCDKSNCIKCKEVHEGPCVDHKRIKEADKKSEQKLEKLLRKKQVMKCPGCSRWIMKNGGCNHMKCAACKKDFNWKGKPS